MLSEDLVYMDLGWGGWQVEGKLGTGWRGKGLGRGCEMGGRNLK